MSGRASNERKRGDASLAAWVLAIASTVACEREGASPGVSAPTASEAPAPAAPPPAAAPDPAPEPPSSNPPPLAEPPAPASATGDPAQVERVLAEYHRIEKLLRPHDEPLELSEADAKILRALLGRKLFEHYEVDGSSETVRKGWLERMSEAASREPPSTIRMPLYLNVGWGCEVPSEWVATGNFDPNVTFILPVGDTKLVDRCGACYSEFEYREGETEAEYDRREQCLSQRCNLQVQGHFTGKRTKPTEQCSDPGHEFHIERATANGPQPTPFFLALPGGAPPPDGPPIADGPRWGVLFSSAFRHEKDARERADALRARLVEKGHANAEVLDSRRIPTLWCCSFAVLVERFEGEKDAKALAKRLKQQGFRGALARTLY